MNPVVWLWLAVAAIAWRVFRPSGGAGTLKLGQSPGVAVGDIGHNVTIEELRQYVPERAIMPYLIERYPQPITPASVSEMPAVVGGVAALPAEGRRVVLDITNFRVQIWEGVAKVGGWGSWTWRGTDGREFLGWRATIHPVDFRLLEELKLVDAG